MVHLGHELVEGSRLGPDHGCSVGCFADLLTVDRDPSLFGFLIGQRHKDLDRPRRRDRVDPRGQAKAVPSAAGPHHRHNGINRQPVLVPTFRLLCSAAANSPVSESDSDTAGSADPAGAHRGRTSAIPHDRKEDGAGSSAPEFLP